MQPSSLTIPKLKAELDARSISYKSNLKKAGLVDLLQATLDKEKEEADKADKAEGGSKKRKEMESEGGNAEASTSILTSTSTKPSKSKKTKTSTTTVAKAPTPPPPSPPPLPPTILNLIRSYLSPFDLRTHLAFSGASKHIRKTCYAGEQAWKELVLGAGFGKPLSVKGGSDGGEWKEVVRGLVKCQGYGLELVGGGEGFRDSLLESKSLLKPLTPEDIVSSETILETNPLMRTIEVSSDWSSMAGVSCAFEDDEVDNRLGGMSLSGLKSVGYALATCPAVTYLGVEQGFSSVKNVDGVTILDVWEALVAKANERITEAPLLAKFVRDENLKDANQNAWDYQVRIKYSAWISTTGLRTRGWALKKSLMIEANESFNGDISQASAGSILFSLGFDEAGSGVSGGGSDSKEDY